MSDWPLAFPYCTHIRVNYKLKHLYMGTLPQKPQLTRAYGTFSRASREDNDNANFYAEIGKCRRLSASHHRTADSGETAGNDGPKSQWCQNWYS